MPDAKMIYALIKPLRFLEIDEPQASNGEQEITPEAVLKFFCTPGIVSDLKSIAARYKEISTEETRLIVAPAQARLLDKLVWPLRNAKAGYMCGNYLGTISLCGMVSEMVAILLFEISAVKLNDKPMSATDQEAIFGSKFEKLGQDRRVRILHAHGLIDEPLKEKFDSIRNTRRRYLHLWSQDHDKLPSDARKAYHAAVAIVVAVIGQDMRNGRLYLNTELIKYLQQEGVFQDEDDSIV